ELERVDLTTAIGCSLVNTLYVLDEPSVGLHPRDTERLTRILHRLRDLGNAVVVVEHDPTVIRAADHVIDLGPGAGERGGRVVFAGPPAALASARGSATAEYLTGRALIPVPARRRKPIPGLAVRVRGASANNLKDLDVDIPLSCFVAVTGVSGSGKSTLVDDVLYRGLKKRRGEPVGIPGSCGAIEGAERIAEVILVDQAPIGSTPRANPATYLRAFDGIRACFARTEEARLRGYTAATFSFNVPGGRCDTCTGEGFEKIEMQFLSDVYVPCAECGGARFRPEILEVRFRGRSIRDVLEVVKCADWVIDLGPEGGEAGGRLVAVGPPEEIVRAPESHTGRFLAEVLQGPQRIADAPPVYAAAAAGANGHIRLVGARAHNLRDLSLELPRDRLIVLTGLSGSGKSSLAFDVLHAEGQRRYVDSLSAYARQFLNVMAKPDLDLLAGLPPTVAIEQRLSRGGRTSTAATVT